MKYAKLSYLIAGALAVPSALMTHSALAQEASVEAEETIK